MPEWSTGSRLSEIVLLRNRIVRERKCGKGVQGLKEEKVKERESEESGKY
jgi:hypothetical protein